MTGLETTEELQAYAALNWKLVERAEKEGNTALARELTEIARETDARISTYEFTQSRAVGA